MGHTIDVTQIMLFIGLDCSENELTLKLRKSDDVQYRSEIRH